MRITASLFVLSAATSAFAQSALSGLRMQLLTVVIPIWRFIPACLWVLARPKGANNHAKHREETAKNRNSTPAPSERNLVCYTTQLVQCRQYAGTMAWWAGKPEAT